MNDRTVTFDGKEYLVVRELTDSGEGCCDCCANRDDALAPCEQFGKSFGIPCGSNPIIFLDPARRLEYITARLKGTA